jgi:hypothetical protein
MGSTTNFTVFNFGPYQSSTKLLHKQLKLNTPPPRRGERQKSKRTQRKEKMGRKCALSSNATRSKSTGSIHMIFDLATDPMALF